MLDASSQAIKKSLLKKKELIKNETETESDKVLDKVRKKISNISTTLNYESKGYSRGWLAILSTHNEYLHTKLLSLPLECIYY